MCPLNYLLIRFDADPKYYKGLTANTVHPGLVMTEVTRNFHWLIRAAYAIAMPLLATVQKTGRYAYILVSRCAILLSCDAMFNASLRSQGACTSAFVASAPELVGVGGKYFANSTIFPASEASQDSAAALKLWEISERLVGGLELTSNKKKST
jgi:hypothetical protein